MADLRRHWIVVTALAAALITAACSASATVDSGGTADTSEAAVAAPAGSTSDGTASLPADFCANGNFFDGALSVADAAAALGVTVERPPVDERPVGKVLGSYLRCTKQISFWVDMGLIASPNVDDIWLTETVGDLEVYSKYDGDFAETIIRWPGTFDDKQFHVKLAFRNNGDQPLAGDGVPVEVQQALHDLAVDLAPRLTLDADGLVPAIDDLCTARCS